MSPSEAAVVDREKLQAQATEQAVQQATEVKAEAAVAVLTEAQAQVAVVEGMLKTQVQQGPQPQTQALHPEEAPGAQEDSFPEAVGAEAHQEGESAETVALEG